MVSFALVMVLARLLTPEAFGVVAAAQVILALSQVVVRFGIGAALVQTTTLTRRLERTAQTLMIMFALAIGAGLLLVSDVLATLLQLPQLAEILPVMLVTFFLSSALNVSSNLISRDMEFRYLSLVDVFCHAIGYGAVAVTLASLGYGYWSLIIGTLVGTMLRCLLLMWRRPVWPTLDLRRDEIRPLLRFGGGVFLSQLGSTVAQRADNLVVSASMGPAALGFYSRACGVMELANGMIGSAFRQALFSGFSRDRRNSPSSDRQLDVFHAAHSFAVFLSVPLLILAFVLNDEIILTVLGQQWGDAAPVLRILALGMVFRVAYKVSGAVILAQGAVYRGALRNLIYALAVIVGAALGANWGLEGVAWAVLAALTLHYLLITNLALGTLSASWWPLLDRTLPFLISGLLALLATAFAHAQLEPFGLAVRMSATTIIALTAYLLLLLPFWKTTGIRELASRSRQYFPARRWAPK